jgi:hypothetical protein
MAQLIKGISNRSKSIWGKMLGRNRRQFQRFVGQSITPVFIGKGAPEKARLVDISIGGISLEYAAGKYPVQKVFALDLHAEDGFQLGKVLLEKVADKEFKEADGLYDHRLRAKFLNLSQVKANKLGKFLEIYQRKTASEGN